MANEIWVGVEQLPKPAPPAFVRWPRAALIVTVPRALMAVGVAALAVGLVLHFRDPGLATGVGEQRNLSLEDGTRISLNTASRVHIHYDRTARRVELDKGEAYFEVAKHSDWPFIVTAGGKQVVARGTAFLVQRDDERVAVTLVEGKVTVARAGEALPSGASGPPASSVTGSLPGPSTRPADPEGAAGNFTLSPGQRLTFVDHKAPRLDRPAIERVTAWQHGQIILDHTPLADAVAEMNRYSDVELKIENSEVAQAQVTGIFRVGDSRNFAEALAETYHLRIIDRGGHIMISGVPGG
jgi:transmembrane sensor